MIEIVWRLVRARVIEESKKYIEFYRHYAMRQLSKFISLPGNAIRGQEISAIRRRLVYGGIRKTSCGTIDS